MNKKVIHAAAFAIMLLVLMTTLCGCGMVKNIGSVLKDAFVGTSETGSSSEDEVGAAEKLSDDQVLSAIRNYCFMANPDLEDIVKAGEYPAYWEISSSDEQEIVVLYRSYTGAQNRYYIDRSTGDTYVTEYVPGITVEEQRTDESFNVREYFSVD